MFLLSAKYQRRTFNHNIRHVHMVVKNVFVIKNKLFPVTFASVLMQKNKLQSRHETQKVKMTCAYLQFCVGGRMS